MSDDVLKILLGRIPKKERAKLHHFKRFRVKGQTFPAIQRHHGEMVHGMILEEITHREKELLDIFEEEYDCVSGVTCTVENNNDQPNIESSICTYVWKEKNNNELDTNKPDWNFEEFEALHKQRFLVMCKNFIVSVNQRE